MLETPWKVERTIAQCHARGLVCSMIRQPKIHRNMRKAKPVPALAADDSWQVLPMIEPPARACSMGSLCLHQRTKLCCQVVVLIEQF